MQPVLEFVQRHERSYTYSIRAPQTSDTIPVACYVDRGLTSLADCVFDAAQALSVNFPTVYIRYQGLCMGQIEVRRLALCAESIARELKVEHQRRSTPQSAAPEGPVTRLAERQNVFAAAI